MHTYAQGKGRAAPEERRRGGQESSLTSLQRWLGNQGMLALLESQKSRPVTVYRDSPHPDRLDAHALTQGDQVFVAPGQEDKLDHELGHVIQQRLFQVKANAGLGGYPLAERPGLEAEAARFGRALSGGLEVRSGTGRGTLSRDLPVQAAKKKNKKKRAVSSRPAARQAAPPRPARITPPPRAAARRAPPPNLTMTRAAARDPAAQAVLAPAVSAVPVLPTAPAPAVPAAPIAKSGLTRAPNDHLPKLSDDELSRHHAIPIRTMQTFGERVYDMPSEVQAEIREGLVDSMKQTWGATELNSKDQIKRVTRYIDKLVKFNQDMEKPPESRDTKKDRAFLRRLGAWSVGNLTVGPSNRENDPGPKLDELAVEIYADREPKALDRKAMAELKAQMDAYNDDDTARGTAPPARLRELYLKLLGQKMVDARGDSRWRRAH